MQQENNDLINGRLGEQQQLYDQVTVVYEPGLSKTVKQAIRDWEASELGVTIIQVVPACRGSIDMEIWIFIRPIPNPNDGGVHVVIDTEYTLYWENAPAC